MMVKFIILLLGMVCAMEVTAQTVANPSIDNCLSSPGIIGTLVLVAIVVLIAVLILSARISGYVDSLRKKNLERRRLEFSEELVGLDDAEIDRILEKRKSALSYKLAGNELGSD